MPREEWWQRAELSSLNKENQEVATAQAIRGPFPTLDKDLSPQPSASLLCWKGFSTAVRESRLRQKLWPSYGEMHTRAQEPGQCWSPRASEASAMTSPATSILPPDCQASIFTHAQDTPEATHILGEVRGWGGGQCLGSLTPALKRVYHALCSPVFLFQLVHGAPSPPAGHSGPLGKKCCGSPVGGTLVYIHILELVTTKALGGGGSHKRGAPKAPGSLHAHLNRIKGITVPKCSNSILQGS